MDSRPTPQLAMALDMIDRYGAGVSNEKLEPPGLRVQTFYNSYPTFTDTNNLSLPTFQVAYAAGQTQQAIADRYGLTQQTVAYILNRYRNSL